MDILLSKFASIIQLNKEQGNKSVKMFLKVVYFTS